MTVAIEPPRRAVIGAGQVDPAIQVLDRDGCRGAVECAVLEAHAVRPAAGDHQKQIIRWVDSMIDDVLVRADAGRLDPCRERNLTGEVQRRRAAEAHHAAAAVELQGRCAVGAVWRRKPGAVGDRPIIAVRAGVVGRSARTFVELPPTDGGDDGYTGRGLEAPELGRYRVRSDRGRRRVKPAGGDRPMGCRPGYARRCHGAAELIESRDGKLVLRLRREGRLAGR